MADNLTAHAKKSYQVETIHLINESRQNDSANEDDVSDPNEPGRDKERETQPSEKRSGTRGKLKVFFSYAPGVGKTFAMLKDALHRLQNGVDVVVGYVDVHGDMQVVGLLEKFEILPQFMITTSGMSYHGMNLNKILARHPQLVLVDHLAQSNPPGLRHEKRYLEVEELLDAGIDVYTTLNIYELESQVDSVSYITGFVMRETVSDQFIDNVEQLELIDLPPQELMERYRSGMIHIPSRSREKLEKFLQLRNLFGVRELALRYVAQHSNNLMQELLQPVHREETKSRLESRLLVCIDANPDSARLVRAGRRMADEIRARWTVVYVETPEQDQHAEDRQSILAQQMQVAERLGARTEFLSGRSVAEVVSNFARKNNIQQVMIGQPVRRKWKAWLGMSMAEQLQRENRDLSIFVVENDQNPHLFQPTRFWSWLSRMQLLSSLVLVGVPTIIGLILTPTVISRSANVVMLYLVSIVIASIFLGLIPALLTAMLSMLLYDFFFIPPIHRLFGFAPENSITFISLMVVSLIISTLVSRERALTRSAMRRADQVTQLYDLSRDLAAAVTMDDVLRTMIDHVRRTFGCGSVILLHEENKLVLSASSDKKNIDISELTAAEWAYQQGRPAGHTTGTFSYANYRYYPLETSQGIKGVMGVHLAEMKPELSPEQVRLLSVYVTKAASAVERAFLAEEANQAEILRVTEKLQTALLNSISHDLRTPLASITGVLSSLRMGDEFIDDEIRRELVETAYGEAERLNRLVGNLLDMTRLESGTLKIVRQLCDFQDVIGSSLNSLTTRLEGHTVVVDIAPNLPLLGMDFVLIQQVMINLLENSSKYSPDTGEIQIRARIVKDMLEVSVTDAGPGVPSEDLRRIFEKFYRVKRFENVVGTGLGLSICKGIIEVHGGKIWAENRRENGLCITFTLPLVSSHEAEEEPDLNTLPEEIGT